MDSVTASWRRLDEPQRRSRIDAATAKVLQRRSEAEGVRVGSLKSQDGELWVRESAADGGETHAVWILPGGPPAVLGDIAASDGDAAGAWRAIAELAAVRGDMEIVAFSAFRGDRFAEALAAATPVQRIATKMQREVSATAEPERITIRPMTTGEFDAYLAGSARGYADELLASGAVADDAAALAEAEASTARLLPEGMRTPGQRLCTVCDEDGDPVGVLWVHLQSELAFIYDIEIALGSRARGLGTQTLRAAAALTREAGLRLLALNVFGSNDAARRLYTREGFVETEVIWSATTSC